jgi:hypothetical protein
MILFLLSFLQDFTTGTRPCSLSNVQLSYQSSQTTPLETLSVAIDAVDHEFNVLAKRQNRSR